MFVFVCYNILCCALHADLNVFVIFFELMPKQKYYLSEESKGDIVVLFKSCLNFFQKSSTQYG